MSRNIFIYNQEALGARHS